MLAIWPMHLALAGAKGVLLLVLAPVAAQDGEIYGLNCLAEQRLQSLVTRR